LGPFSTDSTGFACRSMSALSRKRMALIMAADTISSYIQGLLDGVEFKQTAYALDRDSRKAALARFLKRASGGDREEAEEECRLAA
jgi:hypothetical protein